MYLSERDAIRTMLRRAAIAAANDAGDQQLVRLTGFAGETLQNVVRVQPFGLSSVPPAGGEGLILCLGGRSDRAMFVGGEHRHTGRTHPGRRHDARDAFGQYLEFVQNSVKLVCTETFTVQAPNVHVTGALQVDGDVKAGAISLSNHIHSGVTAGAGVTGLPEG